MLSSTKIAIDLPRKISRFFNLHNTAENINMAMKSLLKRLKMN